MANEITIQGSLTLQRSTLSLQGAATANGNSTTNGNGILNVQSIAAAPTDTQLSIGNVNFAAAGYLFVKNLDTANYVEVGYDEAGAKKYFAKLRANASGAGEFCLLPVEPGKNYYAKANTAAVFVQVAAVEAA